MSTARTQNDEWGVPRTRSALEGGEDASWKWERHTAQAMAQWPEPPLGRSALRQMTRDVTLVWRKKESQGQTTQTPWVIVAESRESAALCLSGVQGRGLGLYAWKDFALWPRRPDRQVQRKSHRRVQRGGLKGPRASGPTMRRQQDARVHVAIIGRRPPGFFWLFAIRELVSNKPCVILAASWWVSGGGPDRRWPMSNVETRRDEN